MTNMPTIYKDAGGIGALPGDNVRMVLDTNGLELGSAKTLTRVTVVNGAINNGDGTYTLPNSDSEVRFNFGTSFENKFYQIEIEIVSTPGTGTLYSDIADTETFARSAATAGVWRYMGRRGPSYHFVDFRHTGAEGIVIKAPVVRELPGIHADQPSTALQPVLVDQGNGYTALRFDGVDDKLPQVYPEAKTGDLLICGRNGSWIDRDVSVAAGGSLSVISGKDSPKTPGIAPALGDIVGHLHAPRTLNDYEIAKLTEYWQERGAKGLLVPSGVELVTNGGFDNDISGWTDNGGNVSWSNGTLKVETQKIGDKGGYQDVVLSEPGYYLLSGLAENSGNGRAAFFRINTTDWVNIVGTQEVLSGESSTVAAVAYASGTVRITCDIGDLTGAGKVGHFDNVSLQKLVIQ